MQKTTSLRVMPGLEFLASSQNIQEKHAKRDYHSDPVNALLLCQICNGKFCWKETCITLAIDFVPRP